MTTIQPDNVPYALEVSPDTVLQFALSRGDTTPNASRCLMTLKHPGKHDKYLAFKVKTTQPRRYLVRPNQGIVEPGNDVTVTIILVDKDRQELIKSFDRLGQTALDNSRDKFLVQSCVVDTAFAKKYLAEKSKTNEETETSRSGKDVADELTGWWNTESSSGSSDIVNKKLQVRHVVTDTAKPNPIQPKSAPTEKSDTSDVRSMTSEQMLSEITSLRRKYDELVAFSVNLTAERDILNNTLEQTKRDLNRETAARASLENRLSDGVGVSAGKAKRESSGGLSFIVALILFLCFFLVGVKAHKDGLVEFLFELPIMGDLMQLDLWGSDEL